MTSQAVSETLVHVVQAPSALMWSSQMLPDTLSCLSAGHTGMIVRRATHTANPGSGARARGLTNDKAEEQVHERGNCAASWPRLQRLDLKWIQPSQGSPWRVNDILSQLVVNML